MSAADGPQNLRQQACSAARLDLVFGDFRHATDRALKGCRAVYGPLKTSDFTNRKTVVVKAGSPRAHLMERPEHGLEKGCGQVNLELVRFSLRHLVSIPASARPWR